MCGISGILRAGGGVKETDLKKMTDAIVHRGPDGEGQWVSDNGIVGLGHRRLAIIDLTDNGKQPMHYGEGRYTITFNGEIYNYIELKQQLLLKGYRFKSESDTEVLMALFDLKREKCLQDLDGMFAFAIWDKTTQQLFCARDRFGEKPFYYHYVPGKHFYFGSEMKTLWAIGVRHDKDSVMTSIYARNDKVYDEQDMSRTFYADIKQLDGAHYVIVDADCHAKITSYYSLDGIEINNSLSREKAAEQFYELLLTSVRLRLRSDVPVGSSLSGGLDSSSIVMLIDYLKGRDATQNTFSARFKNFEKDEGQHIDEVVRACKSVQAHNVWPSGDDMRDVFDKLVYHQEEPFISSSMYAQWKVMECAKQNDTIVLLDGQGADEYLAGYLPYYRLYLQQLFYNNYKKYDQEWHAYKDLRRSELRRMEADESFKMKMGRYKRKLLGQAMPYSTTALRDGLKHDTLQAGLKELLRYADRNAMAHSREVRLPFLSHHLVEFVFSLPDDYKLHQGWTKWILREAMKTTLPQSIVWRLDKIGYEPPQQTWLSSEEYQNRIKRGKEILREYTADFNSTVGSDWKCLMFESYYKN